MLGRKPGVERDDVSIAAFEKLLIHSGLLGKWTSKVPASQTDLLAKAKKAQAQESAAGLARNAAFAPATPAVGGAFLGPSGG